MLSSALAAPAALFLLCLISLPSAALGTVINVPPGQRFCLSQNVSRGATLASSFMVTAGGDLKVRATATAERQGEFYRTDAVTEGSFTLQEAPGKVTVCYSNDDSRADKSVAIYWLETMPVGEGADSQEKATDYVSTNLVRLYNNMREAAEQQRFFQQSGALQKTLLGRLIARINFWTVVKCLTVAGCAVYQVMVVKKHFGKKRTAV